jgi:hypothetical protein
MQTILVVSFPLQTLLRVQHGQVHCWLSNAKSGNKKLCRFWRFWQRCINFSIKFLDWFNICTVLLLLVLLLLLLLLSLIDMYYVPHFLWTRSPNFVDKGCTSITLRKITLSQWHAFMPNVFRVSSWFNRWEGEQLYLCILQVNPEITCFWHSSTAGNECEGEILLVFMCLIFTY